MYHRRVPKLMNHNLEKKRIWNSRDFSECQVEGSANTKSYIEIDPSSYLFISLKDVSVTAGTAVG